MGNCLRWSISTTPRMSDSVRSSEAAVGYEVSKKPTQRPSPGTASSEPCAVVNVGPRASASTPDLRDIEVLGRH